MRQDSYTPSAPTRTVGRSRPRGRRREFVAEIRICPACSLQTLHWYFDGIRQGPWCANFPHCTYERIGMCR